LPRLPHKINNFDETWVENAQPRILTSYKLFHINPHVLADTTKHENGMMPPPVGDGFGPGPSAAFSYKSKNLYLNSKELGFTA